jgi:hypothetical protein
MRIPLLRRTRGALAGLTLLVAMGFGASAALASPAPPCPRLAIGRCNTLTQCQGQCAQFGGDVSGARCDSGCCYCPFAF